MSLEIVFVFILYLIPVALVSVMLRQDSGQKTIMLLVFFGSSLLGEISYLLSSRHQTVRELLGIDFWRTVLAYYPMALFPLGLWGAFLGGLGVKLGRTAAQNRTVGAWRILLAGGVSGAIVGALFMFFYASLAMYLLESSPDRDTMPYILAGLSAGAFSGFLCGWYVLTQS